MKKLIFLLLFLSAHVSIVAWADEADSIRREMPHLQGSELLQAHYNLCRLASVGDDSSHELSCIREYLAEAVRQHDVEAEGLARVTQINCWYNYNMTDSLVAAMPQALAAMAKNGTWDYYYNAWSTLVESYMYDGKLQTALDEAGNMYADAGKNGNTYGLGVSSYCIGRIYSVMERYTEAEDALEESIALLSGEDDISLLLYAYYVMGDVLDALGRYDRLRTLSEEWKATLDRYRDNAMANGETPSLEVRYLYCVLAGVVAEIGTGNYDRATGLLDTARHYAEGRKPIARMKFLQVEARYYAAIGEYGRAIACNMENMDIVSEAGDPVSQLTIEVQQAGYLLAAGRYEEAAKLYQEIIPRKDSMRNAQLAGRIDELRTIFEVDRLMLENRIADIRFYFSIVTIALLIIIVFLYIIYTRRLRRKNRVLYDTIVQSRKMQEDMQASMAAASEETVADELEILYRRLCSLMQDEQAFRNAELKRDELAAHLNTNRTYLAEAVKKYAGGGYCYGVYKQVASPLCGFVAVL